MPGRDRMYGTTIRASQRYTHCRVDGYGSFRLVLPVMTATVDQPLCWLQDANACCICSAILQSASAHTVFLSFALRRFVFIFFFDSTFFRVESAFFSCGLLPTNAITCGKRMYTERKRQTHTHTHTPAQARYVCELRWTHIAQCTRITRRIMAKYERIVYRHRSWHWIHGRLHFLSLSPSLSNILRADNFQSNLVSAHACSRGQCSNGCRLVQYLLALFASLLHFLLSAVFFSLASSPWLSYTATHRSASSSNWIILLE